MSARNVLRFCFAAALFPQLCRADALDSWTWRNPPPQGNDLRAAVYANDRFFVAGDAGALACSADGVSWASLNSGTAGDLYGIAAANGLLVALGTNGTIRVSSDGVSWVACNSPTTNALLAVGYGNGMFVGVGQSGTIVTSQDGFTWSPRLSGTSRHLRGIAYGNGMFVAAGTLGAIVVSTNALDWQPQTSGIVYDLTGITALGATFVAAAANGATSGGLYRSTNGINWTISSAAGVGWTGVTHGPASFVAVGPRAIGCSPDGLSWNQVFLWPTNSLNATAYGAGQFVAVGTNGIIFNSTDGTNWLRSNPAPSSRLTGLAKSTNQLVAVGANGLVLTSGDATNWTVHASGVTSELRSVIWTGTNFLAAGAGGTIISSPDGVDWMQQLLATNGPFVFGICYGKGIFVASTPTGIFTSDDAATWTLRYATNQLSAGVVFGAGLFVTVGYNGLVLVSPDGNNWTPQSAGPGFYYSWTIAYEHGLFLNAGFPGTYIRTSADAIHWTTNWTGFPGSISAITYGNGTFLAAADRGVILTSTDGTNWTARQTKASKNLWNALYANSSWIVVGENGTLLQSDSTVTPRLAARRSVNGLDLTLFGEVGRRYRIQTSETLSPNNWLDLFVFTNAAPATLFVDPNTNQPQRFYRAMTP